MADHRKVINPLLTVSVTGATLEDFSQNAVLLPAAEAPPVLQPAQPPPPTLYPTSDISLVPNQESNFANTNPGNQGQYSFYAPPGNPYQNPQQGAILEEFRPPPQAGHEFYQSQVPQHNFQDQDQDRDHNLSSQPAQSSIGGQPVGLQSVFSSFSSYFGGKLAGSKQEEQEVAAVPSVVDGFLGSVGAGDPGAETPPAVQFYSPDCGFPAGGSCGTAVPNVPGPPPPSAAGNTYRRGGFKRPAYAQIPGLSTGGVVQAPVAAAPVPQVNLPPRPPSNRSPFVPSVPGPAPVVFNQFQAPPSASPLANIPAGGFPSTLLPAVPLIPAVPFKQSTPPPASLPQAPATILHPQFVPAGVEAPSPFLSPVSDPEEIQLAQIPSVSASVPASAAPTILTPTFYPGVSGQPALFAASDMSKVAGDSPRSSPGLNMHSHRRTDSADQPILTHAETAQMYRPVYHHWFYKTAVSESKVTWTPFSMIDSLNLDAAYLSPDLSPDKVVATDGGRYDVNILLRERVPVYWEGAKTEVRRCSWFHKGNTDGRYVPYEENVATKLEEEFKAAFEASSWNRRVDLSNGESVVFHGPDVLVLFPQTQCPDSWGNTPNQPRPRVVKRGMDEFHIEEGEPTKVDHLLFMVHGIGKFCDLKFRGVEEAVDEFRNMALQLVQSHYKSSCEKEIANRIEILPISWHTKLHSGEAGVDQKMKGITLESIPRLREFTNDTILDVLFYTSPVYCQRIISSVGNEMNRIYELFRRRNPAFAGGVSLGGHSLGSLILFDILCHQHPEAGEGEAPAEGEENGACDDQLSPLKPPPNVRKMSRRISYMMAQMGTGQAQISYPHLTFQPRHFFAMGSPVGMFVTVRGLEILGEQFALPTCPAYFNIFHPYDPVAYRIESLVNPELASLKPVLIPHHKGRKRMHLELKETMARVGADLKQKLIDSMKSTWNSFYQFTIFKGQGQTNQASPPSLEEEVDKVLEAQLKQDGNASDEESIVEAEHTDLSLGQLNAGRRIDYVLQEAPLEFFNEYIFALTSHVCYWESNDTILLIVKEIYSSRNVAADSQIPQQTMKIERTASTSSGEDTAACAPRGMDPTMPMHANANIGPPPTTGFVRKS